MGWGAYTQDGGLEELDRLGSLLSLHIHCAVHFPAYNKPIFECACGVVFPKYILQGENWEAVKDKHDKEKAMLGCCS